ncbi:MAG TPA: three-Cys-motif partner protein TcmP [Tepidisphaeraceae bacterium]|jgi:three-Cys-motif partner protein|nr:three-Cys-motif partner protein TcmP [Tepidisphaeraceae bacterium]
MLKDRWNELCKLVETDDGLPTRKVGRWTVDKLWFWSRYLDITTRAMVGNPSWKGGLAYVDLFAGPGVCTIEGTGRRIPGSVLIAANAPKPFDVILASELQRNLADALRARLASTPAAQTSHVLVGDCNDIVHQIARKIPDRALTLAFIDPEGLHANFETIRAIASRGRVDLLILFADRMDIVRNVDLYERQPRSKLDEFLGAASKWREKWPQLLNRTGDAVARFFANEYKTQLQQELRYQKFGEKEMRSANGPIYRLIYASKHERGLEFWDKVTGRDRGGQTEMSF